MEKRTTSIIKNMKKSQDRINPWFRFITTFGKCGKSYSLDSSSFLWATPITSNYDARDSVSTEMKSGRTLQRWIEKL